MSKVARDVRSRVGHLSAFARSLSATQCHCGCETSRVNQSESDVRRRDFDASGRECHASCSERDLCRRERYVRCRERRASRPERHLTEKRP
jgi:uncharacterized protein (DUF3084 family)